MEGNTGLMMDAVETLSRAVADEAIAQGLVAISKDTVRPSGSFAQTDDSTIQDEFLDTDLDVSDDEENLENEIEMEVGLVLSESAGFVEEESRVDVQDVAMAMQRVMVHRGLACVDLVTMIHVLQVCMGALKAAKDTILTVAREDVRRFLLRFGPLRCAFQKARNSLLDSYGNVHVNFWGEISRQRAEQLLQQQPASSYIIRFSRVIPNKLILSYVSCRNSPQPEHQSTDGVNTSYEDDEVDEVVLEEDEENNIMKDVVVRHCGLTNIGLQGYSVRVTESHKKDPKQPMMYFSSVSHFLEECNFCLHTRLVCPLVEEWNNALLMRLRVPAVADDENVLLEDARERHNDEYCYCTKRCKSIPESENISIKCEACGVDMKTKNKENGADNTEEGGELELVECHENPGEMDDLLKSGADYFRNGQRNDAERLFYRVLQLAEGNLLWHRANVDESNPLLKHDSRAVWCKCLSCSSLRAMARAYGNLGHILSDKKKIPEAVEMYEKSLPILREMGMWKQEPIVLSSLTTCAYLAQDAELGRQYGFEFMGTQTHDSERKALLKRLESLGSLDPTNLPSKHEVSLLLREGDKSYVENHRSPAKALGSYGKALYYARYINDDVLEVNALIRLGCCLFIMDRIRFAIVHFERAVLLLRNNNLSTNSRETVSARVQLHNLALAFAKQATAHAGWNTAATSRS